MRIEPSERKHWAAVPVDAISLWGKCGEWSMPGSLWLVLLTLAQHYGWQPAGTLPPDPDFAEEFDGRGQDGSYYPPDGQRMTREDAQNFGQALERLLLDIPDEGKSEEESGGDPFGGWDDESSSIMQRLGPVRSILRSLVTHCRECAEFWLF